MDFSFNLNMGLIFLVLVPVLGAALIAGGIVAYRGSTGVMARAFSAASVVAGTAMWLIIASVTIFSTSSGTAPEPVVVTSVKSSDALTVSKQTFLHLLMAEDIEQMLPAEVSLTTSYRDLKELTGDVDPEKVVNIDSWFDLTIESDDSPNAITFALIDFDSPASASTHFEKMRSAKKAIPKVETSYSGSSYSVEMNFVTIGSMLVVVKGDKLISFQTVKPEDQPALFTLENLDELATLVVSRL